MFNLQALIGSWYRGRGKDRFDSNGGPPEQVWSPYDVPTALINDMISRKIKPWTIQTVDLSAAGSREIMIPGFHVVIYGHNNAGNRAVNTTAYMECYWGDPDASGTDYFPMKHARGLSGPFQKLTMKWPAQMGVYADIIVLSGMHQPWIDGESCT